MTVIFLSLFRIINQLWGEYSTLLRVNSKTPRQGHVYDHNSREHFEPHVKTQLINARNLDIVS
jgi:hypothetical protein